MISSQALIALRQLLMPAAKDQQGVVTSADQGRYVVATSRGAKAYPAAPGITPNIGQRVTIQNGLIIQVVGAYAGVPTYYV